MRDRESTKILPNGAVRYGVYDSNGVLLRYEYIRLEDEPTVQGSLWNRANVLPDDTVARIFDSVGEHPEDPQVKDALDRLNHQVGEIITTRRTDLGDHWALCNGEYMGAYKAPELYRMNRESYEYDIVHELEGKLEFDDGDYAATVVNGSVVIDNTVYSAVMDVPTSTVSVYKWVGDDKSYGPVLVQTISYTTRGNRLFMRKCADWVFIEVAYQVMYSQYHRAFFAAHKGDMVFYPVSYLSDGTYEFPKGGGDSGSATGTSSTQLVYCKIKSDGTMGIAMSYITTYSNSSGYSPLMGVEVLELVNGKWMCVKAMSTSYVRFSPATISVDPYYNPYLGVWQMCNQSYNDTYVYLRSIDIAACYASGSLAITTATNSIWSADGRDAVYGVAYDTGGAIWLIPDYWNDEDDARNYVIDANSITAPTKLRNMKYSSVVDTIRIYNGKIYGFTTRRTNVYGVKVFETIDDLIDNTGTVLTDTGDYPYIKPNVGSNIYMPVTDDIAFDQGLYDHVFTGKGIQTPGYKLPAIAPDASYAYIKIKEATDD